MQLSKATEEEVVNIFLKEIKKCINDKKICCVGFSSNFFSCNLITHLKRSDFCENKVLILEKGELRLDFVSIKYITDTSFELLYSDGCYITIEFME